MEISKDALLRVVKATRISMRISEDLRKLMVENTRTWADEVTGQLTDALFELSGEKLPPEKNFDDSMIMLMLKGDMSDGSVADGIMLKNRIQEMLSRSDEIQQPKPQTMNKEEVQRMYVQSGGYQFRGEA